MGQLLLKLFIGQYIIISIVFAMQGDWGKVMYFVGATILSIGVLMMR
jgi:hypothetical protein